MWQSVFYWRYCSNNKHLLGGEREPKVLVKVNDMKMVCERRMDEGLRTFKDDAIGTIRTIDSGVTNE